MYMNAWLITKDIFAIIILPKHPKHAQPIDYDALMLRPSLKELCRQPAGFLTCGLKW